MYSRIYLAIQAILVNVSEVNSALFSNVKLFEESRVTG